MPHLLWQRTGFRSMIKATAIIPETRIFAGSPGEIRKVRDFVGQVIGGCPATDDVVLLASELATNAVVHSASGADGTFSVTVCAEDDWVRVVVRDLGLATAPAVRRAGSPEESGAGLSLVESIAARWGHHGGQLGRVVWFEVEWQ
jgi:hypothetical protein